MDATVSAHELRDQVSAVLRRVEAGEQLTVTVDRRPVAKLVPLQHHESVPVARALEILRRFPADRQLLADLRDAVPDTTDDW